MSAPKHTPGPWNPSQGSGDQGLVISETTGATVAVTYDEKDTALVAAAPELLEAIRPLLFEVEQILISTKHFPECAVKQSRKAAVSQALAAISKAEART